jgi:hypothetical protein
LFDLENSLVKLWALKLEYAIHELPNEILFEHEFASLDECHKLLELLENFKTHVEILEQQEQFSSLITECELHFRSCRDYLLHGWFKGFLRTLF